MKMQLLRWNNGEPTPGPDTRPASSMVTGAGGRGENPRLRRREENVLDNAFYRSGVFISLRLCFAFFGVTAATCSGSSIAPDRPPSTVSPPQCRQRSGLSRRLFRPSSAECHLRSRHHYLALL